MSEYSEASKIFKDKRKQLSNRNRRSNIELEDDIKRYKEILQRDQDLERDIPPKRTIIKQEETEEITRKLRVRPAASVQKIQRVTSNRKVNVNINTKSKLNRPAYITNHKKTHNKYKQYKKSQSLPPLIGELKPNSLEDSVVMSNSYQGLIKIIKSNMSTDNDIDIPMHYNLLQKNLKEENSKFSIEGSNDYTELSFMNSSIFSSGDIDFFFESLNENTTSSYKEFLRTNVPLA